MKLNYSLVVFALLVVLSQAHIGAFHKGMYCLGGKNGNNFDTEMPSTPMYNMPKEKWWMHAYDGCDKKPPKKGDFLDLPAGGKFTVEMATQQKFTSLSSSKYGKKYLGKFGGNGLNHVWRFKYKEGISCAVNPNLHAVDEKQVSGSAFAISYHSKIEDVTPENLVVFTVNHRAPWERLATYHVPKDLPPCPKGGCICAWGWIPNGCGTPNMYMLPYRCRVTNSKSRRKLAKARPPKWCENNPGKCVKGAKQLLYWHQATGNNIKVEGVDSDGWAKSPAYNNRCGFKDGAQNDIFA